MRRSWDAGNYHRVSSVMDSSAEEVLGRLQLRGDETVLDAGCGTGRVTARLLDRLPKGRVIAVDADPAMVDVARNSLPAQATVIRSDLLDLTLPEPVDVVFSTSALHWILDQDRLFERLAALLRPGGRLVAQYGGAGNVQSVVEAATAVAAEPPWDSAFGGFTPNWYFPAPPETTERLARAGFSDIRCWLQSFTRIPDEPLTYLETIPLGSWVQLLPAEQRAEFTRRVARRLGEPLKVEYVRLNIDARRR